MAFSGSNYPIPYFYRPDFPYSQLQQGGYVIPVALDNSYISGANGPYKMVPLQVNEFGRLEVDTEITLSGTLSASANLTVGKDWSGLLTYLRTDANGNQYVLLSGSNPGIYITASLLPASLTNSVGINWSGNYTHLRTDADGNAYMLFSGSIPGVYITASLIASSLTQSVVNVTDTYLTCSTREGSVTTASLQQYNTLTASVNNTPGTYITASILPASYITASVESKLGTYLTCSVLPASYITASVESKLGTHLTCSVLPDSYITASVESKLGTYLTCSILPASYITASVENKLGTYITASTMQGSVTTASIPDYISSSLFGVVTSSFSSSNVNNERRAVYTDKYGLIHTFNENCAALPANYVSPMDFSASFQAANMIGISGSSFTVNDTNCEISYISWMSSGSQVKTIVNGQNGYTLVAGGNNYVTCSHPNETSWFSNTDLWYRVGIRYQEKGYSPSDDSFRMAEINPLSLQVVEESGVDTTNVAAGITYYPSSTGMALLGYSKFSVTGKFITTGIMSMSIQVTNDEDTSAGDWQIIYFNDDMNDTRVSSYYLNNGTLQFAATMNDFNYRYVRLAVSSSIATNTEIIKMRRMY